jgi:hypothetical protein
MAYMEGWYAPLGGDEKCAPRNERELKIGIKLYFEKRGVAPLQHHSP